MFEPLRIYLANHYGKPFVQNFVCINPFHATRLFLYALKTSKKKNFGFFDNFKGYRKRLDE